MEAKVRHQVQKESAARQLRAVVSLGEGLIESLGSQVGQHRTDDLSRFA